MQRIWTRKVDGVEVGIVRWKRWIPAGESPAQPTPGQASWKRVSENAQHLLEMYPPPRPRIICFVVHKQEEPDAEAPHVRICGSLGRMTARDHPAMEYHHQIARKTHRHYKIDLRGVPGMPIVGRATDKHNSVCERVPGTILLSENRRTDSVTDPERKRIEITIAELRSLSVDAHDCITALWIAFTVIRR